MGLFYKTFPVKRGHLVPNSRGRKRELVFFGENLAPHGLGSSYEFLDYCFEDLNLSFG